MPKLSYGTNSFGIDVPAGRYRCQFTGTEDREPFKGESRFGNQDNSPRMAWVFKVVEGDHKGKTISQETGCRATPKSSCARIILGLQGGTLVPGAEVDTDKFIGSTYLVKVGPNPNSDAGNLYVADLEPVGGPTAAVAPARPNGPPSKPPARPGAAAPTATDARRWWVAVPNAPDDAEPVEMDRAGVQKCIDDSKTAPADLGVCLTTEAEWKTAAAFGCFTAPGQIPW